MDWTAKVRVGQSSAVVSGAGTLNLAEVIAQAIGLSQVELASVLLSEPDHLLVGFKPGNGPLMLADIVVERSSAE